MARPDRANRPAGSSKGVRGRTAALCGAPYVSEGGAGEGAEATSLETRVHNIDASSGLSEKLDATMQDAAKATSERHFDQSLKLYEEAVDIADKIQPHDSRLLTALDYVGNFNIKRNPAAAQAAFERELKAAEEISGPNSPGVTAALTSLGNNAMSRKDYANAEKYYFRAVDINEKVFGEGSDAVAQSLRVASMAYLAQKDYAKAEPYLLRALRTEDSLGGGSPYLLIVLSDLSYLYDGWNKPDKSEPYYRRIIALIEKQYGPNTPILEAVLVKDAAALRSLGRTNEADQVDQRLTSLRASTMKPN